MTIINKVLRPTLHHTKHQHIDKNDEIYTIRLSFRQHAVIHYVIKGMSLNEISNILHIHEKTVSHHKRAAMRKLKLKGITDLYHWAFGHIAVPLFEE
ncbi:TPA: helix-turn-helix transcriptional regulator [Yersinia enterocolitica]|nr:helix-turn-helix transcriptional regulator [Yersinia enterocolitica]